MQKTATLPDHLRCSRTDGRQWRCNRRVMNNRKLCEIHHLQGRHRQYKQKVPDSLKLQRKRRKTLATSPEPHSPQIRAQKKAMWEALDEAVRKMRLKRGDLALELIRVFLRWRFERRIKRELEDSKKRESEGEVTRDLPNGLMAISPALSPRVLDNAGPSCDVKIGIGSSLCARRCFRSKNIEPLPIGALQVVPFARDVANLRRVRRKKYHCSLKGGCEVCSEDRYSNTQEEAKMACPVCRGTCTYKVCLLNQSDIECKDVLNDKSKVGRVSLFHCMIHVISLVLEQFNKDKIIDLEIEAKVKGSDE